MYNIKIIKMYFSFFLYKIINNHSTVYRTFTKLLFYLYVIFTSINKFAKQSYIMMYMTSLPIYLHYNLYTNGNAE